MRLINHKEKKTPVLMIIPMIDIIFFLLVFFMMNMLNMVVQKTMPVTLPALSSAVTPEERMLAVAVSATGTVYLEDEPVSEAELTARLSDAFRRNSALSVVLRGDRAAGYGSVIEVMDAIRAAGITRVSVAAKPPVQSAARGENSDDAR